MWAYRRGQRWPDQVIPRNDATAGLYCAVWATRARTVLIMIIWNYGEELEGKAAALHKGIQRRSEAPKAPSVHPPAADWVDMSNRMSEDDG